MAIVLVLTVMVLSIQSLPQIKMESIAKSRKKQRIYPFFLYTHAANGFAEGQTLGGRMAGGCAETLCAAFLHLRCQGHPLPPPSSWAREADLQGLHPSCSLSFRLLIGIGQWESQTRHSFLGRCCHPMCPPHRAVWEGCLLPAALS